MKNLVILLSLIITSITSVNAQQDAEGCKDHPMFTRMPNYYISECTQNYGQLDFYNEKGEDVKLEGTLTYGWYIMNLESGAKEPSYFQIIKNYENAVIKIGGRRVYVDANIGCFELKKNGKEYKIKINGTNNSDYLLYVLEIESMKQEVTATEMLNALNKDGFIALDILFETGKSAIQQESLPIIDQIYEMLKGDANLKISIEGHTDNVGDATSNKKLSNDRAKSVMDALIAKGIDKTRMSSLGWGQEKPVADNRTDEGKAKNRRVEIVKKP